MIAQVPARLSRSEAIEALARARMAIHEQALELEAAVGGLEIGQLRLGIGTIERTWVYLD